MAAAAAAAAPVEDPGPSRPVGPPSERLGLNPSHTPCRGGALPDLRGARAAPPAASRRRPCCHWPAVAAPALSVGAFFEQRASNSSKLLQASDLRAVDSDVGLLSANIASESPFLCPSNSLA